MIKDNKKTYEQSCNDYCRLGWKILPVKKMEKRPLLDAWSNDYIDSYEMLVDKVNTAKASGKARFKDVSIDDLNIGILCGKVSNIVVIDIDIDHETGYDGMTSIQQKELELHSKLPDTLLSQTQGGGTQMWFRYPKGVDKITSTVDKLKKVDIRADGSQVLVYPSACERGRYYWINSTDTKIAELPKEWVDFLREDKTKNSTIVNLAIKSDFELPIDIPYGARNDTMFKYCCSLLAKGMTPVEMREKVMEVNKTRCNPPLPANELNSSIESALKIKQKDNAKQNEIITKIVGENTGEQTQEMLPWLKVKTNKDGSYMLKIDEPTFATWFTKENKLYYIHESFYNESGKVEERKVKHDIQDIISPYLSIDVAQKVNALLNVIKNNTYYLPPKPPEDIVNLANVSLRVTAKGIQECEKDTFTFNKLPVLYKPYETNEHWLKYINDLFYEEDIPCLQEYLGYLLLPTTKGQKSLFILGNGGEGKGCLGTVMLRMLGNSAVSGELHEIEDNDFMMANLENELLFYDDDLQLRALDKTGRLKKIITMQGKLTVNKKGVQQYEIYPYARFLCMGNGMLKAKYDKSDGYLSRLIIMRVKPIKRRGTSLADPEMTSKLCSNLSGILNWCLEGLVRLISNKWLFSVSDKSKAYIDDLTEDSNNIVRFLKDDRYVLYGSQPDYNCTNKELTDLYKIWCIQEDEQEMSIRTFRDYIKSYKDQLKIEESRTVRRGDKYNRGYVGIKLQPISARINGGK